MRYKAPKTILDHPAVKECDSAEAGGCDPDEYKHDVLLKDGYVFTLGRMTDCQSARFKTAADFFAANPKKRARR